MLKHRRRRISDSYSFSAATATSRKNSQEVGGRSDTKKRTSPRKTVPQSSPAKKKIVEFLVAYGMQLLIVALFMFMVVVEVIVEVVRVHIQYPIITD